VFYENIDELINQHCSSISVSNYHKTPVTWHHAWPFIRGRKFVWNQQLIWSVWCFEDCNCIST